MCEFTTAAYIAAALAVAGTAAQQIGQQQARKAESAAVQAEALRQEEFSRRQRKAIDTGREAFEEPTIQAAQDKAAGERETAYRAAASPSIAGYLPGQSDAPQVVRDAVDSRRVANADTLGGEAQRKAALEAWSDALLGGRIAIGRSAQDVSREASFAQGSRSAGAMEQSAAKMKGQGWRTAGDMLQLAGQVVGMGSSMTSGPDGFGATIGKGQTGTESAWRTSLFGGNGGLKAPVGGV
jgi:hypothetical protein